MPGHRITRESGEYLADRRRHLRHQPPVRDTNTRPQSANRTNFTVRWLEQWEGTGDVGSWIPAAQNTLEQESEDGLGITTNVQNDYLQIKFSRAGCYHISLCLDVQFQQPVGVGLPAHWWSTDKIEPQAGHEVAVELLGWRRSSTATPRQNFQDYMDNGIILDTRRHITRTREWVAYAQPTATIAQPTLQLTSLYRSRELETQPSLDQLNYDAGSSARIPLKRRANLTIHKVALDIVTKNKVTNFLANLNAV